MVNVGTDGIQGSYGYCFDKNDKNDNTPLMFNMSVYVFCILYFWCIACIASLKLTVRPWKSMDGRWNSFWDDLFSGAMLVLGNVYIPGLSKWILIPTNSFETSHQLEVVFFSDRAPRWIFLLKMEVEHCHFIDIYSGWFHESFRETSWNQITILEKLTAKSLHIGAIWCHPLKWSCIEPKHQFCRGKIIAVSFSRSFSLPWDLQVC